MISKMIPPLRAEHQRGGVVRGDDVGMDGLLEHAKAILEVDGPEGLAPFGEGIAAPDVVDQDVEAFVAALDKRGEFLNLGGNFVVDLDGDAVASGGGDQVGSFFDGFALARFVGASLRIFS